MATAKPTDNPHTCVLCGKKLRKNPESYRGPIPAEMTAEIRKVRPTFSVKEDFCKECGQKYFDLVKDKFRKPAWMTRPLG